MKSSQNQMSGLADAPRTHTAARLECHFSLCQVISTRTGISLFTAIAKSVGGSILKSDSATGIVPDTKGMKNQPLTRSAINYYRMLQALRALAVSSALHTLGSTR